MQTKLQFQSVQSKLNYNFQTSLCNANYENYTFLFSVWNAN